MSHCITLDRSDLLSSAVLFYLLGLALTDIDLKNKGTVHLNSATDDSGNDHNAVQF